MLIKVKKYSDFLIRLTWGNTVITTMILCMFTVNIGALPGTLFLYLFCNFSYDTFIILPLDVLLLDILPS